MQSIARGSYAGTYSITSSTIQALPPGYPAGRYQLGDQLLGVPHSYAGATITYSPVEKTTIVANLTHIGHWTNYDYVAEDSSSFGGQPSRGSPRAYWIEYPRVTKLALGVTQEVTRGLAAFVRAENVTNTLRFEQDNSQIPMPRTVVVGANLHY